MANPPTKNNLESQHFLSFSRAVQERLTGCLQSDSANIRPFSQPSEAIEAIKQGLNRVQPNNAGVKPIIDAPNTFGQSMMNAVLAYKSLNGIIRTGQKLDPIVGRGTLARLDTELKNMGGKAADPKTAANEAKPLALKWVSNALFALNARRQALANGFGPGNLVLVNFPQTRIHFHTDRLKTGDTEAASLQRLESNYQKIKSRLLNSDPIFRSVDDATAARETAGQFRPGVILGAYTFPLRSVAFTSHFLNLGPNAKAAMIIHELAHFISPLIGHIGGESGPDYDNSNFEIAINNSHCYPNFATHVTPPFRDERFGLSRSAI